MKIKEKEFSSYNFRKTTFGNCYLKFPALYISNRDIGVFKICQQFQSINHLLRLIFNRNNTIIHLQALISGYNFKHLSLLWKIAGYLLLLEKIEYLNKSFRLFVQRTRKQFHHFGEFMILITVEEVHRQND